MSGRRRLTRDDERVVAICSGRSDELWRDASTRQNEWLDIAKEMYPIAVPGLEAGVSGQVFREDNYIRSTNYAQTLAKKGAAGFAVNLTSPARQWFELSSTMRMERSAQHSVNSALEMLTDAVRQVFSASGIYNQLNKLYEHMIVFGTGCMLVFPRQDPIGFNLVRATTLRFGTYALGIGAEGFVNRVSRKFEYTLNQVVEEFGLGVLPEDIRQDYDNGNSRLNRYTIVNLIEPNDAGPFDPLAKLCKIRKDMAYRSVYWMDFGGLGRKCGLLAVRGLYRNPIIAPRFEHESGDIWGRGRGSDALPIARVLNTFRQDAVNITGNIAEPPIFVDMSLQGEPLNFTKGSYNYYNAREGIPPTYPAIPTTQNIQGIMEQTIDARNELAELFLVTSFATIDALKNNPGVKTATEVNQLVRENMGLLGPIVTSMDQELLDPLVSAIVGHTLDAAINIGIDISPLAPVLQNVNGMKVQYVGEVHQAMKSGNISALERFVAFTANVCQAAGSMNGFDNIDVDGAIRDYADSLGVRESSIASPQQADEARQVRAQMQQQALQMQAMREGAAAAKDGAHAGELLSKAKSYGEPKQGGDR